MSNSHASNAMCRINIDNSVGIKKVY